MIPILSSKSLQFFVEKIKSEKALVLERLWNAPKALLASLALQTTKKNILVITGGSREDKFLDNLSYFAPGQALDCPAWETLPGEEIAPSPDIIGKRLEVLYEILQAKHPKIIIAPLQAVLQKILSKEKLLALYHVWKKGDTLSFDDLPKLLTELGYKRSTVVSDKGQFSVRGGILDVFPVSSTDPYRIDFFGDEIEAIRTFDPIGQKSVGKAEKVFLTPANEFELLGKEKELESLLDYLGNETLIVFDGPVHLEDAFIKIQSMPGAKSRFMQTFEEVLQQAKHLTQLFFTEEHLESLSEIKAGPKEKLSQAVSFVIFKKEFATLRIFHSFLKLEEFYFPDLDEPISDSLLDHLQKPLIPKTKIVFLAEGELQEKDLQAKIKEKGIEGASFERGFLHSGFVLTDIPLAVIPEAEIFRKQRIRRQKWRSTYHTPAAEFHELHPGDLVVHFHSGIGKFLGTEKQLNHLGQSSEFMVIEYSESSKLYVPLSQAHLVSRYIGSSEALPTLSQLGSKRWMHAKAKAQKEIMGYAAELLQLYAEREVEEGLSFPEDSYEMKEFEEEFPYTETPDQLQSLQAIKEDMMSKKPMDRLICGDVGYGKTELAIRAAFKTVMDGKKQVALLVPTTVLAMQHYDTFMERMRGHPIIIEALFRFRSEKEMRATISKVEEGTVDIVIGTHRLLSQDVRFKDLGLIIIDEEQRFGVKAKEHLKRMKKNAHCLTLSATPIPRTLYMSLVKAKDMSVISTPPQDRLPIKTIIAENEDELIQNALMRELAREGQAFFIHNRVESIYQRAAHIQKLIPSAKIDVVHGQMAAEDVDRIFHSFKMGNIDILFSTTIVENGIDVPNANTIIIDRADAFGLADLYQLRGRVGRWNRAAYAYFLTPKQRSLSEISRKRLAALLEAGGYGGGMKIAMRDLEIRGAGDILGVHQSGQVSSIGFHLYCKLLKRTIDALKKKIPATFIETKIEFPFDARLPESYINESSLRMEIYHRLGEASTFAEIDDVLEELKDRFGKPPEEVYWLYHLSRMRAYASFNQFTLLKFERVVLIAEQQAGQEPKKEVLVLPRKIAGPKELETAVFTLLQQKFACKPLPN